MAFFSGTEEKTQQLPLYNPQQQQGFASILQQALGGLQPGQFGAGFEPIAKAATSQFNQQIIPTIAERFTSLGGEGGQRGSGFAQALGQAGAGLSENLAAQKAQFGLQQQGNLLNMLGLGLKPQFENIFRPAQPSDLATLLSSGAQGFGQYLPFALMGNPYMSGGMGLFGLLSSLFGKQNQATQAQQSPAPQFGSTANYMARPSAWNISPYLTSTLGGF
jgi:hypothetical protein